MAHVTCKLIGENLLSSFYFYIKFYYSQERSSKDVEPTFLSNVVRVHKFSRHFMIELSRKQQKLWVFSVKQEKADVLTLPLYDALIFFFFINFIDYVNLNDCNFDLNWIKANDFYNNSSKALLECF